MGDGTAAMAVSRWEYVSEMDYGEEGKSDFGLVPLVYLPQTTLCRSTFLNI